MLSTKQNTLLCKDHSHRSWEKSAKTSMIQKRSIIQCSSLVEFIWFHLGEHVLACKNARTHKHTRAHAHASTHTRPHPSTHNKLMGASRHTWLHRRGLTFTDPTLGALICAMIWAADGFGGGGGGGVEGAAARAEGEAAARRFCGRSRHGVGEGSPAPNWKPQASSLPVGGPPTRAGVDLGG